MIHDDLTRFAWQHVKTKGVYRVLAVGKIEADETPCVTYRNVHSGDVWTRSLAEFTDGRFVETYEITTPRLSPSGEMVERLREALEPFVAIIDMHDERYRRRGGNPDDFPDTHPSFDISASELPIGVFRRARAALAALATGSNRLSLGVEEIRAQAFEEAAKVADRREEYGDHVMKLPGQRHDDIRVWEQRRNEARGIARVIRALSGQSGEALDHQHGSGSFQERVQPWMMECFGAEISDDMTERCDRFIEEAFELVQSLGYDPCRITSLQSYVYNRPAGEPSQEVGGVMVTLAALCLAAKLDMHGAGETELTRIWSKVPQIRAKQAAKPVGSALPMHVPPLSPSPSGDATGGGEVTG